MRSQDGYYTYAGRSDDMLKVSGIYVSPFEVEATLMLHPAVLECAVIGTEDAELECSSSAIAPALDTVPHCGYLVPIQKWWISVQAKTAAISQPQA